MLQCNRYQKLKETRDPRVHIPLDHVILDKLHLMLRIADVLTDNLIHDAIEMDSKDVKTLTAGL